MGDPGSGKTTLGRYVAYNIASENTKAIGEQLGGFVPIVIRAAEFAVCLSESPTLTFFEFIVEKHSARYGTIFHWALRNSKAFVIVDGLDEVPVLADRVTTVRRLEDFVTEFASNRFLITSRIVGYKEIQLSPTFSHTTLVELEESQIVTFLQRWYLAVEPEVDGRNTALQHATELWNAIQANAGIRKLAGNPLLLTIIALANFRGTKLPSRRVELYQIATETLIENWPLKQRGLAIDSEEIHAILQPIAFHMFESGKNALISEQDLRPLFDSQVSEVRRTSPEDGRAVSRTLLETIEQHTGFFLEKGRDSHGRRMYGFLHQTFAEYLTARYLAEKWSDSDIDLATYVHDPVWHEVLLLMGGTIGTWAVGEASKFVTAILSLDSFLEDQLHRDLLFAAEILADNVRVKRDLQDEIVRKLVNLALNAEIETLWLLAAERLAQISRVLPLGSETAQLVLSGEDDNTVKNRKAIVGIMVGRPSDYVYFVALTAIADDPSFVRAAEYVFDYLQIPSTSRPTTHILGITTGPIYTAPISREFSIALLRHPSVGSFSTLIRSTGDSISKRLWVIDLDEVRRSSVLDLIRCISGSMDFNVFMLFGEMIHEAGAGDHFAAECLNQSVSGPEEYRLASLEVLDGLPFTLVRPSMTKNPSVRRNIRALQQLARTHSDAAFRSKILEVLSGFLPQDTKWWKYFNKTASDSSIQVRTMFATLARRESAPAFVIAQVKKLLDDPAPEVRRAAAATLIRTSNFASDDIQKLLLAGYSTEIESKSAWQANSWLEELFRLATSTTDKHDSDLIYDLARHLIVSEGSKPDALRTSLYWASRMKPSAHTASQLSGLFQNHPSPGVRRWAVLLWQHFRTSQGGDLLRLALRDPDPTVAVAAISGVRDNDMKEKPVAELIANSALSSSPELAAAAAMRIGRTRDPEIRSYFVERLAASSSLNDYTFGALWALLATAQP